MRSRKPMDFFMACLSFMTREDVGDRKSQEVEARE